MLVSDCAWCVQQQMQMYCKKAEFARDIWNLRYCLNLNQIRNERILELIPWVEEGALRAMLP